MSISLYFKHSKLPYTQMIFIAGSLQSNIISLRFIIVIEMGKRKPKTTTIKNYR